MNREARREKRIEYRERHIRTLEQSRDIGITLADIAILNATIAQELNKNRIARNMSELHSRDVRVGD